MRQRSEVQWADYVQANERLAGTVILYRDKPFQVTGCTPDGDMRTQITGRQGSRTIQLPENDPGFHRFRKLPPLGWCNSAGHGNAVYLERIPVRSRSHGLNDNNVTIRGYDGSKTYGIDDRYSRFIQDPGYSEACEGVYPALQDVLYRIRKHSVIAISHRYAVSRDEGGVRWLHRGLKRIGMFVGVDTLMLLEGKNFYREELHSSDEITITNIREF